MISYGFFPIEPRYRARGIMGDTSSIKEQMSRRRHYWLGNTKKRHYNAICRHGVYWQKRRCGKCLRHFYCNCMEIIIGKAPGNYSASFWAYKFSICLCERPKPNISMISGFLDPWEPLFMDLNILIYFRNIGQSWKCFRKIFFL